MQEAVEWAAPPDYAAGRQLLSRRRSGGDGGGPAEVLADEVVRWLCVVVAAVPGWGEAQLLQTWAALLKIITTDATATSHFSEDDTGPAVSVSNGPSVARTDMMCTTGCGVVAWPYLEVAVSGPVRCGGGQPTSGAAGPGCGELQWAQRSNAARDVGVAAGSEPATAKRPGGRCRCTAVAQHRTGSARQRCRLKPRALRIHA